MSLVFRNALMPSENQQVLRLRLSDYMKQIWQSDDGTTFETEEACKAYEAASPIWRALYDPTTGRRMKWNPEKEVEVKSMCNSIDMETYGIPEGLTEYGFKMLRDSYEFDSELNMSGYGEIAGLEYLIRQRYPGAAKYFKEKNAGLHNL